MIIFYYLGIFPACYFVKIYLYVSHSVQFYMKLLDLKILKLFALLLGQRYIEYFLSISNHESSDP